MSSILNLTKQRLNKNTLITNENDVFYLTRFKSSFFKLLLVNDVWYGITDSRYITKAKDQLQGIELIDVTEGDWLEKILKENSFDNLWVSSKDTNLESFDNMKKSFESKGITLDHYNYGNIRSLYLDEDIEAMKESTRLNEIVLDWIVNEVKVGMTEKQVAAMIIGKMYEVGSEGPSFDPIVAAGESGASPHWQPSDREIKANEMLTIDLGLFYKGFASDMTRTFVVEGTVSEEEEKIWNVVNETAETLIKEVKAGASASELHQKSIDIIDSYGYGDYYKHSLGHGLGVVVHEFPSLSVNSDTKLEEGMIVTIEPGIYIPGKYGVRIEQDVLVTKDGCVVLNKSPIKLYI